MPVSATLIWLVTVTGLAVLLVPSRTAPKLRAVAESVTGAIPVPARLMLCGLPAALSVTVTEALKLPVAEGEKVTLIVQVFPTARLGRQLSDSVKFVAFVPVTAIPEKVTVAAPVLVTV